MINIPRMNPIEDLSSLVKSRDNDTYESMTFERSNRLIFERALAAAITMLYSKIAYPNTEDENRLVYDVYFDNSPGATLVATFFEKEKAEKILETFPTSMIKPRHIFLFIDEENAEVQDAERN